MEYNEKQLKDYKSYELWKIWDIDLTGKKVNIQYQVSDKEENTIDFFDTLNKAKKYIDTL